MLFIANCYSFRIGFRALVQSLFFHLFQKSTTNEWQISIRLLLTLLLFNYRRTLTHIYN